MVENYRAFEVGPDPFGRTWQVHFRWLQTAISIRHADTVDVKFSLTTGDRTEDKVVALPHPHLLAVARKTGRSLTDPWCMKLAGLHISHMILSDKDMEKTLVTTAFDEIDRYAAELEQAAAAAY